MSHTVFKVSAIGLVSLALIAAENKVIFTGIWIQDASKSNVTCLSTPKHLILKVEQERDRLTVIELSRSEQGKSVLQWDYTLDVGEQSLRKIVFRSIMRHEKWTLSEDGGELLIERNIGGCDGFVRLIFRRSAGFVETSEQLHHRPWKCACGALGVANRMAVSSSVGVELRFRYLRTLLGISGQVPQPPLLYAM